MSTSVCLGQPPLPPKKFSRGSSILNSLLKSTPEHRSHPKLLRRYSLRKKQPDRFSCTYQSFGRDLYEGGEVGFRHGASVASSCGGSSASLKADSESASKFGARFPYADLSESTASLTRPTRPSSVNSVLTMSRSHSDGNISCVSDDVDMFVATATSHERQDDDFRAFRNTTVPCASINTSFTKYLRALSGSWKNLLNLGGMNRPQKCAPQIKKVAPPSVPDNSTYRHSGSSFGSAGYSSSGEDSCFSDTITKDGFDGTDCYGMPGRSPNSQFTYPAFTFPGNGGGAFPPGQYTQLNMAKNAVFYHHQLSLQEDQGIDMTQSPGRDSPGSSGSGSGSRHSTASVDSGRASGCHLTAPHSRSSLSSSSVSSVDHNIPAKVERLLLQGVPDQDVMHSWLLDLHFEEYFPLFMASGYDMPTITKMTPEDLTAIGIKKPNHRKRLKAEIAQLRISDGLPDYIPGSLNEWLRLLRLEEYKPALASQGYETIEDVLQLTWEDLEDIGIVKLGHQKRILLAIKRVKDLKAGKIFPPPSSLNLIQTQVSIESHSPCSTVSSNVSCDLDCPRVHTTYHSFHQPWELETTQQLYYPTADIVPIKVRNPRGKSLESLKDGSTNGTIGGTSSFVPGVPQQLPVFGWKYRSYDDGDITPTNEMLTFHEGGGTLPRPRGLVRPRPVAKIPATCQIYRNDDLITNDIKKKPPSPPKRHSESITVVADLHCSHIPPDPAPCTPPWSTEERQLIASLKAQGGSDSSFKSSSSSTESDSIPFANDNAGTIKQRIVRSNSDYSQSHAMNKKVLPTADADLTLKKMSKEPVDVLDDIGNMLANLTDELDAMLEEEKRQGLNDD